MGVQKTQCWLVGRSGRIRRGEEAEKGCEVEECYDSRCPGPQPVNEVAETQNLPLRPLFLIITNATIWLSNSSFCVQAKLLR